jgi:hypothetical protein
MTQVIELERKGKYWVLDFFRQDFKRCLTCKAILESQLPDNIHWVKRELESGTSVEEINAYLEKYKVFPVSYPINKTKSYNMYYAVPRGSKYKIKGVL